MHCGGDRRQQCWDRGIQRGVLRARPGDGQGATADGTPIQLWTAGSGTNQQWPPTQVGSAYTFTARNSGTEYLDVTNRSTANGTRLQQWTCTAGDTAQSFTLVPMS